MDLPVVKNLNFDEQNHVYQVDGIEIPSVTTIMRPLSAGVYRGIDEETMKAAAQRGTEVHQAIEIFGATGFMDVDEDYAGYITAYQKWARKYNPKIIASEYMTYHPVLWYSGTVDMLAVVGEANTLIDVKTTAQLNETLLSVQLAAYKEMLQANGIRIDDCACLWLKNDGDYRFEKEALRMDIFLNCLAIYNYAKAG